MASGSLTPIASSHSGSEPYVALYIDWSSDSTSCSYSWTLWYYAGYAVSTSNSKNVKAQINGSNVYNSGVSINGKTGWNKISSGTKKISRTKSKQTVSFYVEIAFGSVNWGGTILGTRKGSGSDTINALASYTITYNGNGNTSGSAPSSGTKWYGEAYTVASSGTLTKTNYIFSSWNTASDGSGNVYSPGSKYTGNGSITLYAQWVQTSTWVPPALESSDMYRGKYENAVWTSNPTGLAVRGNVKIRSPFENDAYVVPAASSVNLSAYSGATLINTTTWPVKTVTSESNESFYISFIGTGITELDWDNSVTIKATIGWTNQSGATTTTITLGILTGNFYLMDFNEYGTGIGIGTRAPNLASGGLSVAMNTNHTGTLTVRRDGYDYPVLTEYDASKYVVDAGVTSQTTNWQNSTNPGTTWTSTATITWHWRIWSDGTGECWANTPTITITPSMWTDWGSMKSLSTAIGNAHYPTDTGGITGDIIDFFATNPYAFSEWVCMSSDSWATFRNGSQTLSPGFYPVRPNAISSNHTGFLRIYAVGSVSEDFPRSHGGGAIPDGDNMAYGTEGS